MGGKPCIIIINCGALKAKAGELRFAVPQLAPIAYELELLEGEICDLGEELSEYLTACETEELFRHADEAWTFGERIQRFIGLHHWTSEQIDYMRGEMRTFIDGQAAFFRDLADKHKNDG